MKQTTALLFLSIALAPLSFAKGRVVRPVQDSWHGPRCESVDLPWLRFIDGNGERRTSNVDPPVVYLVPTLTTRALAIGGAPNVLWAITSDGAIRQSSDAGCTWSIRASVPEILEGAEPRFASRHPERVYAYAGNGIVRLTGGTVETFRMPNAAGNLVHLEVDRAEALHLRAITHYGFAYESFDGAATWKQAGVLMAEVASAAFDPTDFDHIIAGGKWGGLRVSHDGGKTWTRGLLGAFAVNDVIFSPADPHVIWVDAWPSMGGTASRLYKSTDGGETFTWVGSNPSSIHYWQDLFAPHPHDVATYATHAWRGAGIKITGPAGTRDWVFENVMIAVWSPSGTLYFVEQVNESR
jgi:photosystem II stability/assembly factor-like uncharacterized protein